MFRSALAKLSAAAEAAAVQLLPVLMVEGQESLLSVGLTDLRAIGAPPHLIGSTAASQPPQQQQRQQDGLLCLDDAAALLAAALQLPSVPVVTLPMGDLLLSAAAAAGSNGSSSGSSGGMLGMVGGLDQQRQLLKALQQLEGQIAGALQQQQQQQQQQSSAGLLSKL
jgi:hypothetical protein